MTEKEAIRFWSGHILTLEGIDAIRTLKRYAPSETTLKRMARHLNDKSKKETKETEEIKDSVQEKR